MSLPNPTAQAGGDGTTNEGHENNLAKFKNSDVIGHPGGDVFNEFVAGSGYFCQGAGTAFVPYLLSTLDTLAWRYNVPEAVYRSEEHTSELQSLMRISYAVFCLKKKKINAETNKQYNE